MKTLIVCASISHGNTAKIADAMAGVLNARVADPTKISAAELSAYDLVGFGSGVRNMNYYRELRQFVLSLPNEQRRKAFVFHTSGFAQPPFRRYQDRFVQMLAAKGFDVTGTFACYAYDTSLPFQLVGGVRKGRPDDSDMEAARAFAKQLLTK